MDYKKIYDSIITNRKKNKLKKTKEQYTENHHIIPKSLGGLEGSNVLRVTGREHFILHALLVRFEYDNKKDYNSMVIAFNNMKSDPKGEDNRYFNGVLFEKYKKEYSRIVSERQTGSNNTQFGTMWITNESLKENKKILNDELIPNGWKKGRINYKLLEENIVKYTNITKIYNKSELDWEDFQEENNVDITYVNFRDKCNKYSKINIKKSIRNNNTKYKNIEDCENDNKKIKKYYNELYIIWMEYNKDEFLEKTNYDKSLSNISYYFKKYVDDYIPKDNKKRKK